MPNNTSSDFPGSSAGLSRAKRMTPIAGLASLTTLFLSVMLVTGCQSQVEDERGRLIKVLVKEMTEQSEFIKVHAAEALITHGYRDLVRNHFESELPKAKVPYSIGVHRVLAQALNDAKERSEHVKAIREVAFDATSLYRVHAIESLAKLGEYRTDDRDKLEQFIREVDDGSAAFAKWLLALSSQADDHERLVWLLQSSDPMARLRSSYALSRTASVPDSTKAILEKTLLSEPLDSIARVYLLSAVLRHSSSSSNLETLIELQQYLHSDKANETFQSAMASGMFGNESMIPFLIANLDASEADSRIGAADGTLHLLRRKGRSMSVLDWSIVIGFLLAMLVIGIFYSLQTQSRDEYLLGGRKMQPWAVGISYFATMFSTITYLSWPGEIIRHGPMILAQIVGFPIAILIVNYFIIPKFMSLPVTSAYEILEIRLGLSIRMLGSTLFLLMRLCWMAVIVHTTSVLVLIPVAGFDPSLAPYMSLAICMGTIVYTALGGFKAVVVTDVAQTLILFGATIAALVTVTMHFGGFGWLPTRWEPHWQRPVWIYDSNVRMTFLSAIVAIVSWHVCTAGSDQMAIQRYLATRDVTAARRMFTIALASNGIVYFCLAALGLSMFAYFKMRPEMLSMTQSVEKNADQFFQQFVIVAMAPGVCGLVVAGLLSAAMDSLSSGINSSSSVVTVDFLERFRKPSTSDSSGTARWISWGIGIFVVALSTFVGTVSGNLLEVTFKVVNLLTAPLFGLFFMALFVRWATPFGTWIGVVVGIVVAVLINYWYELTGHPGISFTWGMPIALCIQIIAGCLASWIPIGSGPRPMLLNAETTVKS
jgi:solute:Na+ symporter, SSS family